MAYTLAQIFEKVRNRVRNTSFDLCKEGAVCYGVPLTPEEEMHLERAGEKLWNYIVTNCPDFQKWLFGITPIFDGNHAYIKVGARPGSTLPPLPAAIDSIPVFVVLHEP